MQMFPLYFSDVIHYTKNYSNSLFYVQFYVQLYGQS